MLRSALRWLLPAIYTVAALSAHAQTAPASAPRADPLDPLATVPPAAYRSTLSTFRRLGEVQPRSWREANDTVGRIGGWRAYAREASQPEAAASAPAPSGPPASPHADHHRR